MRVQINEPMTTEIAKDILLLIKIRCLEEPDDTEIVSECSYQSKEGYVIASYTYQNIKDVASKSLEKYKVPYEDAFLTSMFDEFLDEEE